MVGICGWINVQLEKKEMNMILRQAFTHINSVSSTHTRTFIFFFPKLSPASPRESVSLNDHPAASMSQACMSHTFIITLTRAAEML